MVWKKKKIFKSFQKKKTVFSFGFFKKIIFYKNFFLWKNTFFWNSDDLWKFYDKFYKNRIIKMKNDDLDFIYKPFKNIYFFGKFKLSKKKYFSDLLYIKYWLHSLLKVLLKNGKKKLAENIIKFVFLGLIKKIKNLRYFFLKIQKNMHLPLKLNSKVIAGRKLYIPIILKDNKEIMFIIRFIILSLKNRNEKTFKERLLNELFDTFYNKGFSIKKKIQYNKEIKDCLPNLRYLRY